MKKFLFHLKVLKTYIQVHLGIGMFRYLNGMGLVCWGGGGKGDAPAAPDYSKIAAAQEKAAKYAYDAAMQDLAFRQGVYRDNLPRQQQLYDLAANIAGQQADSMAFNNNAAREQWNQYNAQYRPIELQNVLDSLGSQYLSEDDMKQAVGLLTNPVYDTTDIYSTRQVPTTVYDDYNTKTVTDKKGNVVYGLDADGNLTYNPKIYNADGTQVKPDTVRYTRNTYSPNGVGMGANGLASPGSQVVTEYTPKSKYTTTVTSGRTPRTVYNEEQYISGQNRSINKDFEAQRALALDALAKKASNNAANQAIQRSEAEASNAYTQQAQNLARMGLDPSRLAAAAAGLAQNQTLAQIGAANQARQGAIAQGQGLRGGVANFGRNMPNTAAQSFGLAGQMGNSAVANQNTGFMSGLPYANFQAGGYGSQLQAAGLAQQGALGMGNLMSQNYANQLSAYNNSGNWLGGLMGAGVSLLGAPQSSILGGWLK